MKYQTGLLFLILFFCHPSIADLSVNSFTKYYSIQGNTEKELRAQMNSMRPSTGNGENYDAYTSWDIRWQYNLEQKNGKCHLNTISTHVDIVKTMPRWNDRNRADSNLREKWDYYYAALMQHEDGHKKLGIEAAKEIESILLKITPQNTCSLLENKANNAGQKTINKYKDLEKAYDLRTRHGMNSGAVFP